VKAIGDKVEDVLTKVGAIYGQGIMEAGVLLRLSLWPLLLPLL
jgi:hypothetical protein